MIKGREKLMMTLLPLFMPSLLDTLDMYEKQIPLPKVDTPNKDLLRKLEQQSISKKKRKRNGK